MPGRANNSGNGSNNQNRVNKNAAPRSNEDLTCRNCNRVGHLAKDCQSTTSNNAARLNNNGEKHCENHPHLTNHSTAECKIQKNNKTKTKTKNNEDRDGDVKMDGFAYAVSNTVSNANAKYCLICNSRSHYRNQCNNVAAAARLTFSNCVCWKCHLRGHMGDDCENPSAKFCDRCHKSGHATVDCKSTSKSDGFRAQLALSAVRSERAFEVSYMTYPVTANAQPVPVAPATAFFPTTSMQIELPAPTTFVAPPKNDYAWDLNWASFPAGTKLTPSGAHYLKTLALAEQRVLEEQLSTTHKQIRAHCEEPKYLYPKHKANNYIRDIYHVLLENQILTPERLQAAHFGMAKNPG
ncbi:hypothetical protein LTR78_001344 [Recurvomyces mirabilis]|uniref:CCHC-type domain-containing protein n=1 Tax=Recurvomyces mirabilis TaxID=574656 RepID=A0AAE0WWP0_9PEZI|nr:hypothetical protein LTR78_001344 [Recurvomyces mirabilis]KAK5161321.1 hypothetical protein LTS14_001117 [Recurvomyces mirabilis]